MSSSSDYSSSNLGSGSLGSESPPQEILRSSSFGSITVTPSMISLPSRQNAGEDASAISNAANYNENNGSGSYKSQGQSSSKNKNGRIPTLCILFSTIMQALLLSILFITVFAGWKYFEDTFKYGYGISTFLQFELLFVFLLTSCIGNGGLSFFACFNVAALAIVENVTVLYVLATDWNDENCYSDGCTFLHGPYKKRTNFLEIHATFGVIHLIMTFVLCCVGCYSSRRNVTSSNPSPALPSKNHNTSQAPQKRTSRSRRRTRSQSSSFKSSRVSDSQSSRASSYRSSSIKYSIRVKPSTTKSMQRRHETTLNIPQKRGYPFSSSSYPQGQHLSTVCHPSLPPPIPCGYHQSFVQQQHFPLQNNTNNYVNGGRTMIIDVPENEKPYEFIDIQRVVVKLPPLKPSESATVPPAYRVSSKQENGNHERVFCTRVAEFK